MAGKHAVRGESAGPGNKAIATTLLEWLAVSGRSAARDRAVRALGLGERTLAEAPVWLPEGAIASMFVAAEVDPSLARSIGHRLVSPDATGLRLYGLGLATPEKAYRRLQSLLPRAEGGGRWSIDAIAGRSARVRFETSEDLASGPASRMRAEAGLCAFRKGLLEAIPGLYGLLPAEVEESACRVHGASACCYEVRWQVTSRAKTMAGGAVGLGVAMGLVAASAWLEPGSVLGASPFGATVIAGLAAVLMGPMLGRMLDLQNQLEAVAGARRGHLALFDQVDDALAEKLDALARADASLETGSPPSPVRRALPERDESSDGPVGNQREILAAAQQIHAAAGDLECWFETQPGTAAAGTSISDERGLVREIREWSARIAKGAARDDEETRVLLDLGPLVRRAIATLRPSLAAGTVVRVETEDGLRAIECEPVQIEFVVLQLVRNAVEASVELTQAPEVVVRLQSVPRGAEIVVEDRGVGIDSVEVDEVFDPFFGDRPAGSAGGMGLAVCLRIIERHAGEMRIEAEARVGTRVTVFLPGSEW